MPASTTVRTAEVASQPWRNGGGVTRPLLVRPRGDAWQVRVSVADVSANGPFSRFPGVQRWFAVLEGAGVVLTIGSIEHRLDTSSAAFSFRGDVAVRCRLVDGPTRDLNLMLRKGQGTMRPVDATVHWQEDFAMRGLFARLGGRWTGANASAHVAPRTLLWDDAAERSGSAWRFEPDEADAAPAGWWLGFTPEEALP